MVCAAKCYLTHREKITAPLDPKVQESYKTVASAIKTVKREMGLKEEPLLIPQNMGYQDWKEMFEYTDRTDVKYRGSKDWRYFKKLIEATEKCIEGGKAEKVSHLYRTHKTVNSEGMLRNSARGNLVQARI